MHLIAFVCNPSFGAMFLLATHVIYIIMIIAYCIYFHHAVLYNTTD